MKKILAFTWVFFFSMTAVLFAGDGHLYSTWDVLETDASASAWLIKRHVDPKARFKFFPKGELITEGIAFDTRHLHQSADRGSG